MATQAEIVLPGRQFDDTLSFFREKLGFRLDAICPADNPAVATLSAYGVRIRLDRTVTGPSPDLFIRTESPDALFDGMAERVAPNGTKIRFESGNPPLALPRLQQAVTVRQMDDEASWGTGRAGMLYRDLIPGREGGRFIASHIRIPNGGPVPDNVHFHKIRFQMIYVYKGWVRLVYEDQGEPFVMEAGSCVLQPPQIRHRVLESSDGLEVIEIGSPADHMTLLDHDLDLPTGKTDPARDFSGQRYALHVAATATWSEGPLDGFKSREVGIAEATDGLARVAVLRQQTDALNVADRHDGEFLFQFVLEGGVTLALQDRQYALQAGDSFTLPADVDYSLSEASGPLELLRVQLPG
ncbi:MAG: AraC family ligand binding domain-containing protein [Rhodospirillaceae bacterium]|nr:AraC family ligand binding domain-containing protein [Rhodospirillaceae bacterium]